MHIVTYSKLISAYFKHVLTYLLLISCLFLHIINAYFCIFLHILAFCCIFIAYSCICLHICAILHPGRPGHCPGVYVPPHWQAPIPLPRLWVTGPTIKVCSLSPHAVGEGASVPHWNPWERLGQDGAKNAAATVTLALSPGSESTGSATAALPLASWQPDLLGDTDSDPSMIIGWPHRDHQHSGGCIIMQIMQFTHICVIFA